MGPNKKKYNKIQKTKNTFILICVLQNGANISAKDKQFFSEMRSTSAEVKSAINGQQSPFIVEKSVII